jgi:hypothetical protein
MVKYISVEFANSSSTGIMAGPPALTNNKQEYYFDQTYAENLA